MKKSLEKYRNNVHTSDMKRGIVLSLLILNIGCQKDKEDSAGISPLTGGCSYSATQVYSGPITAGGADTFVNVQYSTTRNDRINVTLCRNSDCTTAPPSTFCSNLTLTQQIATPCKAEIPSVMIKLGTGVVRIKDAGYASNSSTFTVNDIPAFSTYVVSENICL